MNITFDSASPQIQYLGPGWSQNHSTDASISDYFDSTFTGTYNNGDAMKFDFNGSAIYVYGSKRQNHGTYSAQLDGQSVEYLVGGSNTPLFQQVLFSAGGLSESRSHAVTLVNLPSQTSYAGNGTYDWWLDIDYIVVTAAITGEVYSTQYDDTSTHIQYSGTGWGTGTPIDPQAYYNSTAHISFTPGDSMFFAFNGSSVALYGGLYKDHGNYTVELDGFNVANYNGTYFNIAPATPLFVANNLTDGPHSVRLTNGAAGPLGNFVDFDYVVVNSTINPSAVTSTATTSTTTSAQAASATTTGSVSSIAGGKTNVGAIAGGVVGGVVALALIGFLIWFLRRRRSKRDENEYRDRGPAAIDLMGEESKPYDHDDPQTPGVGYTASNGWNGSSQGYTSYSTEVGAERAAREMDQSRTPFLSVVPPPPASNVTSYPHSINPPSTGGLSPTAEESNPLSGGSDSTGQRSLAMQQQYSTGSPIVSTLGSAAGAQAPSPTPPSPGMYPGAPGTTKTAGVALPFTARPITQSTNTSGTPASPTSTRQSSAPRMQVPGREQDMGPIAPHQEEEEDEDVMLPPDYRQATEPLPGQVPTQLAPPLEYGRRPA